MTAACAEARVCPVRWAWALACLERTSSAISAMVCSGRIGFPLLRRFAPLIVTLSTKTASIAPARSAQDRRKVDAHIGGYYVLVYAHTKGRDGGGLRASGWGAAAKRKAGAP